MTTATLPPGGRPDPVIEWQHSAERFFNAPYPPPSTGEGEA